MTKYDFSFQEILDKYINEREKEILKELWYKGYYAGYTDKLHKRDFHPFKREGNDEDTTKG